MELICTSVAVLSLLGWSYLMLFHGQFWRLKFADPSPDPEIWPSVDIIVPARNEAEMLPRSLASLLDQDYPGGWRVLLVDDHSVDGTAHIAQRLAEKKGKDNRFDVIAAPGLPKGWSGKVAAMQAGVAQSYADYILFTDADIEHPRDSVRRLVRQSVDRKLDLNSLMVCLHCSSVAEQFLIPAFVFFFALLYPFRLADNPDSSVAAAAGGVMLVRRWALDNIGGLAAIKSALIDDCSLARKIKASGGENATNGRIELSLASDVKSLRLYPEINDIWAMVARTAFTQLRQSPLLLAGTVVGMGVLFLAPPALPLFAGLWPSIYGLMAWTIMTLLYVPTVLFFRLPLYWALTLPAAAVIYIGATLDSARLAWSGRGGQWKGRAQA